ncbi:hypothetical protein BGX38DRAFT_1274180 [Terfezia claveryi]|nr:hypothetical protein BGX38DRAFT_1274180 [Terfezia claveryi]
MGETAIIIGIDFGTTYSGVSWALTSSKRVNIINDWRNLYGAVGNQDKVPSSITYTANGRVNNWGYMVDDVKEEPFQWIKIMLDPSHKYFNDTAQRKQVSARLERLGKTPEDVVADYLKCLWDYTIEHLKRRKGDDFQSVYTVKVVLTVPAVWSAVAKDKTLKAARRAGIRTEIKLVTEPEAAALALLKDKCEETSVKVGDGLVVCDAGGGTVDLISYKVESLKPLKIRECVMGDGELCGSVFLDIAFEQHIRSLVGERQYDHGHIRPRDKKTMLRDFQFGTKRSFRKGQVTNIIVDLKGVQDDETMGIDEEVITISPNTLREIFDSICQKIQALLKKQLRGIQSKGITAKAIGLVGGFGESTYLYEYLQNANSDVRVIQEPGAISAVCRGATLWGLEQNHATSFLSRIARSSYGIVYQEPWDPTNPNHQPSDKHWDSAKSQWRARGQMTWLLKRGEEVVEGHVLKGAGHYSVSISPSDCGNWTRSENLYYSDAAVPPGRQDDSRVKQLCSLSFSIPYSDIRRQPTYTNEGKVWTNVYTSRDILCGGALLDYRIMYDGKLLQNVEANYVEDD